MLTDTTVWNITIYDLKYINPYTLISKFMLSFWMMYGMVCVHVA